VSDDKFEDFIERAAKGYRAGGTPPADRMWSRIEPDVARAIQRPRHPRIRQWTWLAASAGIAAALVIGIAIGRRSVRPGETVAPPTVATAPVSPSAPPADSARDAVMRALMLSHLGQAEVFLTEVRADLTSGRHDPQRGARSRQLLARTRLIMASDARRAPAVERLLEDLELVLAEIAALPPASPADSGTRRSTDARLVDERLRVGTVLPRIRTILPGPATGGP
jgi:hypothetical protein